MPPAVKKVVIIGAGAAGVFTAVELQKSAGAYLEITILEKNSRIGGHTRSHLMTQAGEEVHIDDGAQFFSKISQPEYYEMLETEGYLAEPWMIERDVGITVWNVTKNEIQFKVPTTLGDIIVEAFDHPRRWLNFSLLVMEANLLHLTSDWSKKFGDWLDDINFLGDPAEEEKFKARIARPLMYEFGLVSPGQLDDLSAKFVVYFFVKSMSFSGAAPFRFYNSLKGLDGILEKLVAKYGLSVKTGHEVQSIVPSGQGYSINVKDKAAVDADEIVFATNPAWTRAMLPPASSFDALRAVLDRMKYLMVPIHIHYKNPHHMPTKSNEWSVANVLVHTDSSGAATNYMFSVWFGPLRDEAIAQDVIKSWGNPQLIPSGKMPTNSQDHHLMIGTPEFIEARQELRSSVYQGVKHLWFCGGYILEYDTQNASLKSARAVAYEIAQKYVPQPLMPELTYSMDPKETETKRTAEDTGHREVTTGDLPPLLEEVVRTLIEERPDDPAVREWKARFGLPKVDSR